MDSNADASIARYMTVVGSLIFGSSEMECIGRTADKLAGQI